MLLVSTHHAALLQAERGRWQPVQPGKLSGLAARAGSTRLAQREATGGINNLHGRGGGLTCVCGAHAISAGPGTGQQRDTPPAPACTLTAAFASQQTPHSLQRLCLLATLLAPCTCEGATPARLAQRLRPPGMMRHTQQQPTCRSQARQRRQPSSTHSTDARVCEQASHMPGVVKSSFKCMFLLSKSASVGGNEASASPFSVVGAVRFLALPGAVQKARPEASRDRWGDRPFH